LDLLKYNVIFNQKYLVTFGATEDLMCHKYVLLKVSIFVWRLLHNRLPMKTNLVARDIISPEAHFCVSGCGGVESAQHFPILLVLFRHYFGIGLTFWWWTHNISLITLFSLLIQQVVVEHVGLLCNSSD
jgi:hypothetical protein